MIVVFHVLLCQGPWGRLGPPKISGKESFRQNKVIFRGFPFKDKSSEVTILLGATFEIYQVFFVVRVDFRPG